MGTWEAKYDGTRGQPPIHPRILAGAILYGLSRGVRSSRHLEYLLGLFLHPQVPRNLEDEETAISTAGKKFAPNSPHD